MGAANESGGEDNITVVLFTLAEAGEDEDTLSGLEGYRIESAAAPRRSHRAFTARATRSFDRCRFASGAAFPPPKRRAGRLALIVAGVLALFTGIAALALWGVSRANFVGATDEGRLAVYQGVPWDLPGGKLYRETYVSRLVTAQLSPDERASSSTTTESEEGTRRIAPTSRKRALEGGRVSPIKSEREIRTSGSLSNRELLNLSGSGSWSASASRASTSPSGGHLHGVALVPRVLPRPLRGRSCRRAVLPYADPYLMPIAAS